MKNSWVVSLPFVLVSAAWCAPKHFEGQCRIEMKFDKNTSYVSYSAKGRKVRVETEMEKGRVAGCSLMDFSKNEMIILMPDQKKYMRRDISKETAAAGAKRTGTFVKTDEKKSILGYPSVKYVYTHTKGKTDIWATEKLGAYFPFQSQKKEKNDWQTAVAGENFFPLESVDRDLKGRVTMEWRVVEIKPGTLKDSLFAVPADYQAMEIPGFGAKGEAQTGAKEGVNEGMKEGLKAGMRGLWKK